jgi:hypothetical protein
MHVNNRYSGDRQMNKSKVLAILFTVFGLTGCASGANLKADCPSARGVNCQMFSKVDAMITSGEIEEAFKDKDCKGKNCKNDSFTQPELIDDLEVHATYKQGARYAQ